MRRISDEKFERNCYIALGIIVGSAFGMCLLGLTMSVIERVWT